jgi:lipopolysaccharide export system permease protein
LRILDKFILKSFIGPYILSFFIAEFVLIMQFLWKYIDDILGKGFTMFDILELVLYYSMSIVPMALPISILLVSVMVFGDISEKYELSSIKSAGVSLLRIMRPAIYLAIGTALFSIFSSNYLKPVATYQFKKRFDLIRKQKSTLSIEPGIFNSDFDNFVIRIDQKNRNDKDVKDIIIYDHSQPDKSLVNLIKADSAEMYATPDGHFFVMNLKKGEQYQEMERNRKEDGKLSYPMIRTTFKSWAKVFDMSNFYLSESDLNINRNREDMLNTFQLLDQIDTLNSNIAKYSKRSVCTYVDMTLQTSLSEDKYHEQINVLPSKVSEPLKPTVDIDAFKSNKKKALQSKTPKEKEEVLTTENAYLIQKQKNALSDKSEKVKNPPDLVQHNETPTKASAAPDVHFGRKEHYNLNKVKSFYETFDSVTLTNIFNKAVPFISTNLDLANSTFSNLDHYDYQKQVYILRLGQQYSFALVCVIFLFIGAPMGSIIRKGGYGYPLLIAILFYMLFIITTIVGEKLLKSETIPGWLGAWLPCIVLIPFGMHFTYQALQDIRFSWFERFEQYVIKLFTSKKKKAEQNASIIP